MRAQYNAVLHDTLPLSPACAFLLIMMPMPINTQDWCSLQWTEWVPLQSAAIGRAIIQGPGVYRIRHKGGNPNRLVYIGQTGDLRGRLQALARCVNGQLA